MMVVYLLIYYITLIIKLRIFMQTCNFKNLIEKNVTLVEKIVLHAKFYKKHYMYLFIYVHFLHILKFPINA